MGDERERAEGEAVSRRGALQTIGALTASLALSGCGASSLSEGEEDAGGPTGGRPDADVPEDMGAGALDAMSRDAAPADASPRDGQVADASNTDEGVGDTAVPDAAPEDAMLPDAQMCVVTPEQIEGPYFLDTGLNRRDITEDRQGVPLTVRFNVVEAPSCRPLEGAIVELWHADAEGAYSGFDEDEGNLADHAGRTFLRGYQRADAQGQVEFTTIYPGWYPGRAPHVHVQVILGDDELAGTQFYFDDAVSERVYGQGVYAARGKHDTNNIKDTVSRRNGGPGTGPLLFQIAEEGNGVIVRYTIGVVTP
ncbi:MAG: intradiol ring-cleavage dioxygenase [Bradymonadia bacterium]